MDAPLFFGPYGAAAAEVADRIVACGGNALWFHGFDERLFEVCRKHGLSACVEFPTFRADFAKQPNLVPIGVDGRPIRYGQLVQGICLSQEEHLARIEEALRAGVAAYRPAGIWLDYLAYAGWFETPDPDLQESCFCPACIADFRKVTGVETTDPRRILSEHGRRWTEHKCRRIAAFAERYASIIREKLPACPIGAYLCPWLPSEYDGALTRIFAQSYPLLAPYIDGFTPLIYARKSGRGNDWGARFLAEAPGFVPAGRKVQLILDALDFPECLTATAASDPPSWGFQVYGGAELFTDVEKAEVFRNAVQAVQSVVSRRTAR